jgi:hypothetical protein
VKSLLWAPEEFWLLSEAERAEYRCGPGRGKWVAQCSRKHCGSFNTEIDAAAAYNLAAIKTYGEYAWINKI